MNVKDAYESANIVLVEFGGQAPVEIPDKGTDHDKVQYLLDEYSQRLKKKFWRYRLFRDNRKIPEMICQYLGKMLTEDELRKPNKLFQRSAKSRAR
ncbi:MAG: hypothetical protein KG012_20955 [Deltaproteobacteria bacterium]|nr:hypothetical protein [Deltaproteobacteria bacterium]